MKGAKERIKDKAGKGKSGGMRQRSEQAKEVVRGFRKEWMVGKGGRVGEKRGEGNEGG